MGLIDKELINSALTDEGESSTEEILDWIKDLNNSIQVEVKESSIENNTFWFYDDYNGEVLNRKRSFFSVKGMRFFLDDNFMEEQPMIYQPEIGYLGILAKEINGTLHFLMQAKIEPGNSPCVQISPTLQATKSNFTRAHGGKYPLYLSYFEKANRHKIIYDQIQSEQGTRFFKKRNRNMVIIVDEDIEPRYNYKWMTLGQIKNLMKLDNLVNMDTRTVISGLFRPPFYIDEITKAKLKKKSADITVFNSLFSSNVSATLPNVLQKMNNCKMMRDAFAVMIPLNQLMDWYIDEYGIFCRKESDFEVRYYDISIEGREVQNWFQPLLKSNGKSIFALLTRNNGEIKEFLIRIRMEIGTFDTAELAPTIQWETTHNHEKDDIVEKTFFNLMEKHSKDLKILYDVILSEEGGRFYREQNRNIIADISNILMKNLPKDYIWTDYATLCNLIQMNNTVNIQLRNLVSLIKI